MTLHDPARGGLQARAEVAPSGDAILALDGAPGVNISPHEGGDVREQIASRVLAHARMANLPVTLVTRDPEGEGTLRFHPTGQVETLGYQHHAAADPEPALPTAAPSTTSEAPVTRQERRRASFITADDTPIPAARGWRGALGRVGIRLAPGSAEISERDDTRLVSQHWPGPRTIAIVNGKGGANKTPTTALLAAVFARSGGAGVLAWDNNETRGTLGWRTEQGRHESTVHDLLPAVDRLLSPEAQSSELAHYVHHQTGDKYDVLRSNPQALSADQHVTRAQFDRLHQVATKYFRLIFLDSGNDESAERWQQMIDRADQLVVATTEMWDRAEAGALLLEALADRGDHSRALARNAVAIVSQSERSTKPATIQRVAEGFVPLTRAVVTIPYDEAMHRAQLRYDSLKPATQRAWLRAGAAIAQGL